ncbi:MAG: hypothetical protein HN764_15195 [Gammaproteobacteria bacterium]|nr:hypothetical protein [Gammaproteobacteria bacterium]
MNTLDVLLARMHLVFAVILLALTPPAFGLTLEQSRQFREMDYNLLDGITIEYKGEDKELFFVDNGQPYHYSRIQQEQDGDLFRWVGLGEMKQAKYVKYLAMAKERIPEIVVTVGGLSIPDPQKTAPDTICDLVYDHQTGKPKDVYLVDFENKIFDPVLEEATRGLREELGQQVTIQQTVLFFYNRCFSQQYPIDQVIQEVDLSVSSNSKQVNESEEKHVQVIESRNPEEAPPEKKSQLTVVKPESKKDIAIESKPVLELASIDEKVQVTKPLAEKKTRKCAKINNEDYEIEDDESRGSRLADFVRQLEYVDSWGSGEDSYSKLVSTFNIAYPIFVHYDELSDELKKKYVWIIGNTYDIPKELYIQLPCQKRNAMNSVFEKILGKNK